MPDHDDPTPPPGDASRKKPPAPPAHDPDGGISFDDPPPASADVGEMSLGMDSDEVRAYLASLGVNESPPVLPADLAGRPPAGPTVDARSLGWFTSVNDIPPDEMPPAADEPLVFESDPAPAADGPLAFADEPAPSEAPAPADEAPLFAADEPLFFADEPAAETPTDEPVDDFQPLAEDGLAQVPEARADEDGPLADALPFEEELPEVAPAEAEAVADDILLADDVPAADGGSFTDLMAEEVPMAEGASFSGLLGEHVPDADPASFAGAPADPAPGSDVKLGHDPVSPVAPASGWMSSTRHPAAAAAPDSGLRPTDESAAAFDAAPAPHHESSDIFGAVPMASAADSQIIDAAPADGTEEPIEFDLAEEDVADGEPLFGGDSVPARSLFDADDEDIDTGATPAHADGASSIMGDLGGEPDAPPEDSGVRLDDPGIGRTLTDDAFATDIDADLAAAADSGPFARPAAPRSDAGGFDLTVDPADYPELTARLDVDEEGWGEAPATDPGPTARPPKDAGRPTGRSGSDLFAQPPSGGFPAGDPLDPALRSGMPSLTSSPSSIFSGDDATKGGKGGLTGGSVRIGRGDPLDPADGGSAVLHGPASGAGGGDVDFNLPSPSPEGSDEISGAVDWTAPLDEELTDMDRGGPASGLYSGSFLDDDTPAAGSDGVIEIDDDAAMQMLTDDDDAPAVPRSAVGPVAVGGDWETEATADEDEPAVFREPAHAFADEGEPEPEVAPPPKASKKKDKKKAAPKSDPFIRGEGGRIKAHKPRSSGKRSGLVGGLVGLLAGVGICSGLYFGGVLDEDKPAGGRPSAVASADAGDVKQLQEEKAKADAALKDAEAKLAAATTGVDETRAELTKMIAQAAAAKVESEKATADKLAMESELAAAKEKATTLDADAKRMATAMAALDADAKKAAADAEAAKKEAADAADKLAKADAAAKAATESLAGVAKELQTAGLVAENADAAAVLAAAKEAASRASGPNVGNLLPAGVVAVAGAGLPTAHLVDLADRVGRSEAAVKAATDKAAKDAAAMKAEQEAAVEALKTAQAAELKKAADELAKAEAAAKAAAEKMAADATALKDEQTKALEALKTAHAAEMKKAADGTAIEALKEAHAAELKKVADATAAELKKAAEENAAALAKLTADQQAATKKLEEAQAAQLEAVRKKAADDATAAAAQAAATRADLANVMTPSQALDLWLPLLSEARRPADAPGALAAADKVLATAAPGSPEAAKAHAVKGLALLVSGKGAAAKDEFTAVRQTATGPATADLAKLAAEGTAAADDPLARLRRPADAGRKDPDAAVKALDAGMRAFAGRRYADAETALTTAVWHDPENPVAWYYLGASRWQLGRTDKAKDDFRQGAEREKAHVVPTGVIETAIAPIQGSARTALANARP